MNDMTMAVSLEIGDNLLVTTSGAIDTGFCLCFGDICFPHAEWTDLSVSCLCMWTEELISLIGSRSGGIFKLRFMDGSYYLRCQRHTDAPQRLTIACMSGNDCCIAVCETTLDALLAAIAAALVRLSGILHPHIGENARVFSAWQDVRACRTRLAHISISTNSNEVSL